MKTILIAEDDPFLAKLFLMNLERESWNIVIVGDGRQAIEAIEAGRPDILLLDLIMPVLDGYAVLQHIKAKEYAFPVFVLSNLSQDVDVARAKQMGASALYIKSELDLDQLAADIQQRLDQAPVN